jgi:hypothetical protein
MTPLALYQSPGAGRAKLRLSRGFIDLTPAIVLVLVLVIVP